MEVVNASLHTLSLAIKICLGLAISYLAAYATYDLCFNPLSRFPGPKLWAVSRIPYVRALQKGTFAHRMKDFHEEYGLFVRVGPNEVSIADSRVWQDVYGYRTGFAKNPIYMAPQPNGYHSIVSAGNADHSRIRRLLAHAFSEAALREQEVILQSYVELLITRLRDQVSRSVDDTATIDIMRWMSFAVFDIAGDLTFGESFRCLEESTYHTWVALLLLSFKSATYLASFRLLPGLAVVLRLIVPKSIIQKRNDQFQLAKQKVHKRLELGGNSQRSDFMAYVLRYNDEKGMSIPEIEATFSFLVLAGGDTTASALSGIMNNLLHDAKSFQTLLREIRSSFQTESEISCEKVAKLPFLNAVIEETLRLCPPVPAMLPRLVPAAGGMVCGQFLPANTFVSIPQFAAYRLPTHFSSPNTFIPSRWLLSKSPSEPHNQIRTHNPAIFQPFSHGSRNCLGKSLAYMEMRLIVAKLIWNFDIVPLDGKLWAWESQKSYVLWQKRGLEVGLKQALR